jgi:N-alpha-acetyltransferase 35, NatC auxiliary subunit
MREIVLSGFQLELYSVDEKPIAYWYASEVIDAHLTQLDQIASLIPPGKSPIASMSRVSSLNRHTPSS